MEQKLEGRHLAILVYCPGALIQQLSACPEVFLDIGESLAGLLGLFGYCVKFCFSSVVFFGYDSKLSIEGVYFSCDLGSLLTFAREVPSLRDCWCAPGRYE